jgi:hypothetical protein
MSAAEEIVMRTRSPRKSLFNAVSFLLAVFLLALPMNHLRAMSSSTPLFLPVVTYDAGGGEAGAVAIADVNGDGKPDLVVANCGDCQVVIGSGSVAVMLGNGDGTFQKAVPYGSGGVTTLSVAVADVNGDGKPDVVVANRCQNNSCAGNSTVGVLLGNGDGTFQPVVPYGSGGMFSSSVAVADVNADGKPDVLLTNQCSDSNCDGSVGVLLGNGDGTFQAALTYPAGGNQAFAIVVADVNGDGKPDLLATTHNLRCSGASCGVVAVLLGNGDGTFQPAVTYPSGGHSVFFSSMLAVADVNGDGKPDIVVENGQCCFVADGVTGVLLGNGDGTFNTVVTYKLGAGCDGTSATVADVNGDGKPDLIVTDMCTKANGSNEGVAGVFLGNGDGTFQPGVAYSAGGFFTYSVAVADLNGDGKPDLVVTNLCAGSCLSGSVGVLLNNGAPLDTTPPTITLSATPKVLWPPNGRMAPVTVSGTITDTGSGVNLKTAVFAMKDEYGEVQPAGAITLGPAGNYSFSILLQASRLGSDTDGRRYMLTVRSSDNAGNTGSKTTMVTVPHDQRR